MRNLTRRFTAQGKAYVSRCRWSMAAIGMVGCASAESPDPPQRECSSSGAESPRDDAGTFVDLRGEALPPLQTAFFERGGARYEIAATVREGSDHGDHEIVYTVRRDGELVHNAENAEGRLPGCHYGGLPTEVIRPLRVGDVDFGWVVSTGGICGNTFSFREQLVVVPETATWNYFTRTFMPKSSPLVESEGDGRLSVTYVYQEWVGGGTAESFFVPVRLLVDIRTWGAAIEDSPLPSDLAEWPKLEEFCCDLRSYVVAGINTLDPAIIQAAVQRWTPQDGEALAIAGLPQNKDDLLRLADGLEMSGAAIRNFHPALKYRAFPR